MRPRRRTPVRTSALKKGSTSTAGEGWTRLLVLFVAAGVIFWFVSLRSDKGSSLAAIGVKTGDDGLFDSDLGAGGGAGDEETSPGDEGDSVVAGEGRSGAARVDAATGSLVLSPAGVNDTASADAAELAHATSVGTLAEKQREEEEAKVAAAAEAVSVAASAAASSSSSSSSSSILGTFTSSATSTTAVDRGAAAQAAKRRKRRKLTPPLRFLPVNGSFPLVWMRPRHRVLRVNLDRSGMRRVHLDASRFAEREALSEADPEWTSLLKGPECPEFEYSYAYDGFKHVASCHRSPIEDLARQPAKFPENCHKMRKRCVNKTDLLPHEKWAAQVLLLHNVYVNVAGQVFNRTHYFDHNGCAAEHRFRYTAGQTKVVRYKALVSMINWYGWNARTILLDVLPQFVTLDQVLPLIRNVPVAFGHRLNHQRNQMEQMIGLGINELLGVRLERLSPQILQGEDLFFAERLFLPLHQRCGRPSRAMWQFLRTRHLLPPHGLPLYRHSFHDTFRKRFIQETTPPGPDWLALVGVRDESSKTPLVEQLKLQKQLLKHLPASHVQLYHEGALSFLERKKLLNRARLLVSTHENLLADMVFMPPGGVIFELRAVEEPDPTYHHLAEACGHEYHLLFVEGYRPGGKGRLRVNEPIPIYRQLRAIAKRLLSTAEG